MKDRPTAGLGVGHGARVTPKAGLSFPADPGSDHERSAPLGRRGPARSRGHARGLGGNGVFNHGNASGRKLWKFAPASLSH